MAAAVVAISLSACNKLELDPTPIAGETQGTTPTLATLLDDPNFSLLKSLATKAGMIPVLSAPTVRYTVFAPDNAAVTASLTPILPPGVTPEMYIASLDQATSKNILQYHMIPQSITTGSIPATFPNFQYPSLLNPAPSVSPLLRLTTFPSIRANGGWVNNIPIVGANITAVNGVVHKIARVLLPPTQDLWARINAEADLTYLKATIDRADSGVAAGGRLQDALSTAANPSAIAANLTVFAPNDDAMKAFLIGAITQALMAQGIPAPNAQAAATLLVNTFGTTIISNPASIPDVPGFPPGLGNQLAKVITPTLAKGIVVYHILSSQKGTYAPPGVRAFSVNLPSTAANVKTLLNSAIAAHPGLTVQATFANLAPGVAVVTAATVKGAANATASNIIINPSVPPYSSDINLVNGVIHKIDQVLRPQ
ncbi:MAG: hypothetical protein RL172_1897 [Bacteroidota bacterium]